jgi:hypothetical protein
MTKCGGPIRGGAGPLGVNGNKLPIETIIMAMQWGT